MTKIDQFESAFRSAAKEVFSYEPIGIDSVLVVTDLEEYPARQFGDQVRQLLSGVESLASTAWQVVHGGEFASVRDLLDLVEKHRPGLICTYRNLHSEAWKWPFTLGDHLEVLTQATTTPVLVLPHPEAQKASDHAMENTDMVMAMTDHLTGDSRLVNFAVAFTEPQGRLWLTHIEDAAVHERYIEVISKIDTIDTDDAREAIHDQLLKEPHDFIRSCREVLAQQGLSIQVEEIVTMGYHLKEYEKLVEEHKVDLLVLNTKDEEQLAMHGMAYPLAVELRMIPLLML